MHYIHLGAFSGVIDRQSEFSGKLSASDFQTLQFCERISRFASHSLTLIPGSLPDIMIQNVYIPELEGEINATSRVLLTNYLLLFSSI